MQKRDVLYGTSSVYPINNILFEADYFAMNYAAIAITKYTCKILQRCLFFCIIEINY